MYITIDLQKQTEIFAIEVKSCGIVFGLNLVIYTVRKNHTSVDETPAVGSNDHYFNAVPRDGKRKNVT